LIEFKLTIVVDSPEKHQIGINHSSIKEENDGYWRTAKSFLLPWIIWRKNTAKLFQYKT